MSREFCEGSLSIDENFANLFIYKNALQTSQIL